MIRLVQLSGPNGRRLAMVDEPNLVFLEGISSVYDLARRCLSEQRTASDLITASVGDDRVPYDEVYAGTSAWKLLPAADHPEEPARCLVSGTGLTHVASARNRQAMHGKPEDLTDSTFAKLKREGGAVAGTGSTPDVKPPPKIANDYNNSHLE